MAALSIQVPYPVFYDRDGQPLDNGNIYIGVTNLDPVTNPLQVYYDAALTITASQPLVTSGGYIYRNGTPTQLYVDAVNFSITVNDSKNLLVYNFPDGTGISPNADGIIYNEGGAGAVDRTVANKLRENVSVKDFGAVGDGITNDTVAIQAALNSGAKRVFVPAGTYVITATLTIPDNVSLEGDGIGATIFDGSSATYANLTSGRHISTVGGSWGSLPALSADVNKGDRTLTFASAPSIVPGDVLQIYNPTDFSFSGFRAEYRAGEFIRVAKVSGTTVTLQGTLCDSYLAADVDLYKLQGATSCNLRGFTLKGLSSGGAVFGINFFNAVDSSIEDVRVYGCSYTQISVNQCFNVQLRGCTGEEDFTTNFGGDYGLAIANSHIVNVSGGYYAAARHGVTTGGFSGVGCVSCRYMSFQGVTISTSGDAQAADFHGNMEYSWFDNCVLDGGFAGGGDYFYITNNVVRGNPPGNGNILIYVGELRGTNFKISNNICSSTAVPTASFGGFIHATVNDETPKGGVIDISDNTFVWEVATSNNNRSTLIVQSGYIGAQPIDVVIKNNTVSSLLGTRFGSLQVSVVSAAGVTYRSVEICNNVLTNAGAILVRGVLPSDVVADKVIVNGNVIENVPSIAIDVEDVSNYIECRGNHIINCDGYPIDLKGTAGGSPCYHIDASDNTAINNLAVRTSSTLTSVGLLVENATYATIRNNVTGSFNQYIVVASNASFVVGETITGNTSGATATITGFRDATEIMISRTLSGSFTVAETITGSISGSTSVTISETYCQANRLRLGDIGNLCVFNNNDLRLIEDSIVTISSYLPGCVLTGIVSYDPPSLIDGDGVTTTVTVTGATLGNLVSISADDDLQGVLMTAWVSAADTVSVRFQNETGGPVNIPNTRLLAQVTTI
jgi:hypothetical protein